MLEVLDFLLNAVFLFMPLLFYRDYVNFFRKVVNKSVEEKTDLHK